MLYLVLFSNQQLMPTTHFFERFGLTKNEQNIYLFLLSHGAAIASIIGKRLGIKRVTVYSSLESLERKRLLAISEKQKVTYYGAIPPEQLVSLCEEKVREQHALQEEAQKILPELKKLALTKETPIIEIKGKISYYQGLDAVKNLIFETLNEGPVEQLSFGLNTYYTKHLEQTWREYIRKRVALGMPVRSIQPNIAIGREYKQRDKKELRNTRLIPPEKSPPACEVNIIGDMIALFTLHGEEPIGVKIYNKEMAKILRGLFELAWEQAGDYDENKKIS